MPAVGGIEHEAEGLAEIPGDAVAVHVQKTQLVHGPDVPVLRAPLEEGRGLHGIGVDAVSADVDLGEEVGGVHVLLVGRPLEPLAGEGEVPADALAARIYESQVEFRIGDALVRLGGEDGQCGGIIVLRLVPDDELGPLEGLHLSVGSSDHVLSIGDTVINVSREGLPSEGDAAECDIPESCR